MHNSANGTEGAGASLFHWAASPQFSDFLSLWPPDRFFLPTSDLPQYVGACSAMQCNGGGWLIARYQEMGSRTDPWRIQDLAPPEQIHPAASLDGNDRLGGAPINILAFSLCPTLKPCVGGWWPIPLLLSPPVGKVWRAGGGVLITLGKWSHTRHSWLVAHP